MRWPWTFRRRAPTGTPQPSCDAAEAAEARAQAESQLEHTKDQSPEVTALAAQLRAHRYSNHFAELFGNAIESRREE